MYSAFQALPDETLQRILNYAVPPAAGKTAFERRKTVLAAIATLSQSCARVARFLLVEHVFLCDFLGMAGFVHTFDTCYEMRRAAQYRNKTLKFDGGDLQPKESVHWTEQVLKRLPAVSTVDFLHSKMCLTTLSIAALLTQVRLVGVELRVDSPSSDARGRHTLFLPNLQELILCNTELFDGDKKAPLGFFLNSRSLPSLTRLALVYHGTIELPPALCNQLTHLLLRRLDISALLPRQVSCMSRLRHLSLEFHTRSDFDFVASNGTGDSLTSIELHEARAPELERKFLGRESLVGRSLKYVLVEKVQQDLLGLGGGARGMLRAANEREATKLGIALWEVAQDRDSFASVKNWFNLTDTLDRMSVEEGN